MGSTTIVRAEPHVSPTGPPSSPPREEVRAQLVRLLASPPFQHSKHYPGLLRYVVNETLEGRAGHLKERSLGVEVFGRDPGYDTNADPVVRTSACEVRKRIAQYYHEPGHEAEVRIDLSSGSYTPEFRYPPQVALLPAPAAETQSGSPAPAGLRDEALRPRWVRVAYAAVPLTLVALGTLAWHSAPSPAEKFWSPVLGSGESVVMALGGNPAEGLRPTSSATAEVGPSLREVLRGDQVAFSDALTLARLTGVTREFGRRKVDIRRAAAFSLTDLRKGPVILIGAFNNAWTMELESDLRFRFEWDDDQHTGRIRDRRNPNAREWTSNPALPYSSVTRDFAVVSRFHNPLTEKMVVVVAGLGRDGTIAAGEFVTEPRYLEALAKLAPGGWEHKNLQVLLATDIVKGTTGPPQILATHFW